MDISSFYHDDLTDEEKSIDDFKKILFKLANRGFVDTIQYAYFNEFANNAGTLCNINLFINKVSYICSSSKPLDELDILANNKLLKHFKITIGKAFEKFLVYDEENDILRINKNIKYYLTRVDTIDFTKEQKTATHTLYNFLIDNTEKTFGLYGYAGSGKTTTVVEFISYMLINKYLTRIAFVAPTNQALDVIKAKFKSHIKKIIEKLFDKKLSDMFNFEDELEFLEQNKIIVKFLTITQLLMFQRDYSASGEIIFVRDNKSGSMIPQFELIIIDECSMINMDTVDNIFEEVRLMANPKNKGVKHSPKIIFTGDPAQLPPVNEEDSSIFCKSEKELLFKDYMDAMLYKSSDAIVSDMKSNLEQRYKLLINDLSAMKTMLLQNVVRSRLGNVTKICHELREWIKSDDIPNLEQYRGVEGVYFCNSNDNYNKVKSEWFEKCLNSIKKGLPSIIVTWTNKQTDIYNDTIRRSVFKGQSINKFEVNDVLILREFYGLDLGEEFVKQKLHTSTQIKVLSTKISQVPINQFEMPPNSGLKQMKQGLKLEGSVKQIIDSINMTYCKSAIFKCWVLKVQKFGENTLSTHNMTIIVIDDDDFEKYDAIKKDTCMIIKNYTKQLLSQYKSCTKQVERFIVKPLWKNWNKVLIEPFARVNYGYSITCHKAQGSSFYDVYIDLDDILKNPKEIEGKKCAYTAATRTSNELNIIL